VRLHESTDRRRLRDALTRIRGGDAVPDAAIVIPVNAQGDLQNVLQILQDVAAYDGPNAVEVIFVVNNYDADQPPGEIDLYREMGVQVVAVPSVRRPGEAVGFSARIPGVRQAQCEPCILFDADCRIPDVTPLIDWYVRQFQQGAAAAYTHVAYYGFPNKLSVRFHLALHHAARWAKRTLLGIPTTRGSNYAVKREVMLNLYAKGMLADEMNVGPTFKAAGHRVAYSGAKELTVLTSGRMFRGGWLKMIPYFWYRFRYNLRTLPVRVGIAKFTGRESDPVRRYVNNRPVR